MNNQKPDFWDQYKSGIFNTLRMRHQPPGFQQPAPPSYTQPPPTLSGLPQHHGAWPYDPNDPTQGGKYNPMPTLVPTGMQHLQPGGMQPLQPATGSGDPSQQYGSAMPQIPGYGQSQYGGTMPQFPGYDQSQYGAMMPTIPGAQAMQSQFGGNQGAPIAGTDYLRQLLGG